MYIVTIDRSLNDVQGFLHPSDIIYATSCKSNLRKFLADRKEKKEYPVLIFEATKISEDDILKSGGQK
jgi:hypothetical protein